MLVHTRALAAMVLERTVLRRALVVLCALAYLITGFFHLTQHLDGAAPGFSHQIVSVDTADDPPDAVKKAAAECCCVCASPAMPFVANANAIADFSSRFILVSADPLRSASLQAENPPPIG